MPCVVRYRWDRVRYYNEFCNDGKSFCYWYVAYVGGERVWKLLHKDCECPCDCEDPERVGYNKYDLQVFSTECPNYRTPDRGLGDVSELPEDLQKEKLPSTHFVKTKCAYAIKDCWIRFKQGEPSYGQKAYYYPRATYQYHDKLPCIYINNQITCTDQKFVQCQDSPAYYFIYRIDPIPEEDFVRLNLWGGVPCTVEIRCAKDCDLTMENAYSYLIELDTFFNNSAASLPPFRIYNLRPENQALFQPFLPAPIQIDGPPIYLVFDRRYYGISRLNHVRYPPSRKSEPIPDNWPVGRCLYIITSTGEKYVYHTCSEGEFCPEINWRREQVKGCPEKDYIVTITNCEDSREESTSTTTTLGPRFPFCAWESVPLQETFTYYEIEEREPHGDGLSIKRVIREVRKAKYYDIKVAGHLRGGKFVSYDSYGSLIVLQRNCSFAAGTQGGHPYEVYPFRNEYFIFNDSDGNVPAIYLHINGWRDDIPIPEGVIKQYLDKHHQRCGSIPNCGTYYGAYIHNLEEHNKRALLPGLFPRIPLSGEASRAAYAYGFSYLESFDDPDVTMSDGPIYFFNPALFAAGPDRYCKLTYDGYTWVATGTCDRCDVYIEMLNHIMKVCFRKKLHPFIEVASFPLPEPEAPYYSPYFHNYERVGAAFFEASRYTCLCTVGDVVQFLNQIWPFEIYLSCPLDLPDSDYLYFYRDNVSYGFLPCGANKAPAINIDLTKYGRYLIPCIESTDVVCEPQNARRIFWAFVPWVYQPCLCREWPPS